MSLDKGTLRDGVIAGVLAGAVVAVLFYFYDLGQGTPFRTPAYLFGALFQGGEAEPTVPVVATYTALHFAAWAFLGVLARLLVRWADIPRNVLIGAAYGLFACSILFYGGLVLTGIEVFSGLAWPAVFFGNALAGMVMFGYLHWRSAEPGVIGLMDFLAAHRTMREGLVAGLIGATVVAVWFLIIDVVMRGQAFYTPAALGAILFQGGGPEEVVVSPDPVIGYTLVHFAAFILFGAVVAGLVDQIRNYPALVFGLVILFVVFEVFFVAMTMILGAWVLERLAWWSVLGGNLLAAASMGIYLWRAHPELRRNLQHDRLWAE